MPMLSSIYSRRRSKTGIPLTTTGRHESSCRRYHGAVGTHHRGLFAALTKSRPKIVITVFICLFLFLFVSTLSHPNSSPSPLRFLQPGSCISPEGKVTWILDGECMPAPHHSQFSSVDNQHTCGFCGDSAAYLAQVRDELSDRFRTRCQDMVVYGVAFGESYEGWLRDPDFLGEHHKRVVEHYGTCCFQFITNQTKSNEVLSADGSQILIVLDETELPYSSNRRNAKLFKLSPGLIFPWAERVIWQDAKLLVSVNGVSATGLPTSYHEHFRNTVERFGTCTSFMGLPHHSSSVSDSPSVTLNAHCQTIVEASVDRPTVSDRLDAVKRQCTMYEYMYQSVSTRSIVFHQQPLIDSAFIVYDMRSSLCRQFVGDLTCSWLDEIHCYSDRDQVSFPSVLASSGVHLSPNTTSSVPEMHHRVFVNTDNIPMVHISKRSCHWYYQSFARCLEPPREGLGSIDSSIRDEHITGVKVAIIVAGVLKRFIFESTVQKLISPLTKKNIVVDYYCSLTTASALAYRSGATYMNFLQPDPSLPTNISDSVLLEKFIRAQVSGAGGSIGELIIQHHVDIDAEPMLQSRRMEALLINPSEDPDLRFPLFDIRNAEIGSRTANANRNLLRMHLAIQNLWQVAINREESRKARYDFVLFLRDDSLWLSEFNLDPFIASSANIFVPACDARTPPMDGSELSDHLIISRRKTADLIGNYYSTLFSTDLEACMDRLSNKITGDGRRGCNSEMLLKYVLDSNSIEVEKVGQGLIPFQRAANVMLPDGSVQQCFHKFCQSYDNPLIFPKEHAQLQRCQDLVWRATEGVE